MTKHNENHTCNAKQIPCEEISDSAVFSKNPLISVKMITYNHEPYISRAIEGVVKQETEYPFELIIGEDCSTDGTMNIVKEYQRQYPDIIRVITSDKNVGAKKNSIRTSKACRGKYIALCEGDDYWHHPYKLQKQANYLEMHPDYGMISADCDIYYNRSKKIKRSFNNSKGYKLPLNFTIEQILWEGLAIWTCTVMIRRKLVEQILVSDSYLFQNEALAVGDLQLWAVLTQISKALYMPETFATYRILEESASKSKDPRNVLRFKKSLSDIRMYLCDKYNLSQDLRRKEELNWCNVSLQQAFYGRNIDLAREVRERQQTFTWKEWIRYFGVKYSSVHYGYRAATLFTNLFRKKRKYWP